MTPFGQTLQHSHENARIHNENSDYASWLEENYCSPSLTMERKSVINRYFSDIAAQAVESEESLEYD